MLKKIILTLVPLFVLAIQVFPQIGAQVSMYKPIKDLGYLLKPGPGLELSAKSGDIDSRFRVGGFIGFAFFKPTQDTFHVYTIESGNGTRVLPGWEHIRSYQLYTFGVSTDFKILNENKKFSPLFGVDSYMYLINYSEDYYYKGVVEGSTENENLWELAIVPKIGVQYEYDEAWLISAGCGRSMGFGSAGLQTYWKPYINILYFFD